MATLTKKQSTDFKKQIEKLKLLVVTIILINKIFSTQKFVLILIKLLYLNLKELVVRISIHFHQMKAFYREIFCFSFSCLKDF